LQLLQLLLANQNPHPRPLSISWQRGEKLKDWNLKKSIRQQQLLRLLLHYSRILQYFRRIGWRDAPVILPN
jgi:hypothetical protein